jgi:hypothetical protein
MAGEHGAGNRGEVLRRLAVTFGDDDQLTLKSKMVPEGTSATGRATIPSRASGRCHAATTRAPLPWFRRSSGVESRPTSVEAPVVRRRPAASGDAEHRLGGEHGHEASPRKGYSGGTAQFSTPQKRAASSTVPERRQRRSTPVAREVRSRRSSCAIADAGTGASCPGLGSGLSMQLARWRRSGQRSSSRPFRWRRSHRPALPRRLGGLLRRCLRAGPLVLLKGSIALRPLRSSISR